MDDCLKKYIEDGSFDLCQLLNDDFFEGIRLTYSRGKYISSSKLLFSFIDTIAYVCYGDEGNVFTRWLNEYVDMSKIEAKSEELWECRNSMVHMSNLDSRKCLKGQVKRVIIYIGVSTSISAEAGIVFVNYTNLIHQVAAGIGKMASSFSASGFDVEGFFKRYDSILSDSRYVWQEISPIYKKDL